MSYFIDTDKRPELRIRYQPIKYRPFIFYKVTLLLIWGIIGGPILEIIAIINWNSNSIPLLILSIFGWFVILMAIILWPYPRNDIRMYKNHFIFNPLPSNPFYNPTIKLDYSDVDFIQFIRKAKLLKIYTNKIEKLFIISDVPNKTAIKLTLIGIKEIDINNLIHFLWGKSVKIFIK